MKKSLKAQLSSKTDNWTTPEFLYEQMEKEFGKFDFDPCPLNSIDNALLEKDWNGNVFCNPPYSNVEQFLNKGLLELQKGNAKKLVFLIIPRTSTAYWKKYVMGFASKIYFIPYRLKFGESKSAAPFPSVIIIFEELNKKDFVPCYVWKYLRPKKKKNVDKEQTKLTH